MQFKEYLEEEKRLELELLESIYREDPNWIADESVMDIVKGAGRVIKGVAQTGAGFMSMGDEAIARAMGDGTKGRFKGGWDRLSKGIGNIGSGVKQVVVGDRGSTPVPARLTPVPAKSDSVSSNVADQKKVHKKVHKKPQIKLKVGKEERVESDLQSLINQYRSAKEGGERNRILAVIAMRHPKWYQEKLKDAKNRQFARSLATSG